MDKASPVGSMKELLQMRCGSREYWRSRSDAARAMVQWWMCSLRVSTDDRRGTCGRSSRSGAVDKAGTEWAVVQWWMSSLLVSRGGGRVDATAEADPARWTPLAVNGLWYAGV